VVGFVLLVALLVVASGGDAYARKARPPEPVFIPAPDPTLPATGPGQIAFTSNRDGNPEIYVMAEDGTGPTRLTFDPANDDQATWCPADRSKLAFATFRSGISRQIFIMNADGTDQHPASADMLGQFRPTWSWDCSKIAFTSNRTGIDQLFVIDLATGVVSLVPGLADAGAFQPAFSPIDDRLLFTFNQAGVKNLYIVNLDGTELTKVTRGGQDVHGEWRADGRKIVFESTAHTRKAQAFMVKPDGSDLVQVTNLKYQVNQPTFSPDGNAIAFRYLEDIHRVAVSNAMIVYRLTEALGNDESPQWFS